MGCCSSQSSKVDPAGKAIDYELTDLKIEELIEFMSAVGLDWIEVLS